MKTVKVKRKNKEKKDVAGILVGLVLLALIIGGGYYLFNTFRQQEITPENLAGDWKLTTGGISQDTEEHWVFNADGTAMHYVLNKETNVREGESTYVYELNLPEGKTQWVMTLTGTDPKVPRSKQDHQELKITALSHAEMNVIFWTNHSNTNTTRMTKDIF